MFAYSRGRGTPTAADQKRNADYDRTNVFGDRTYFANSHREGGDYALDFYSDLKTLQILEGSVG